MNSRITSLAVLLSLLGACEQSKERDGRGDASGGVTATGGLSSGGGASGGDASGSGGALAGASTGGTTAAPKPEYHPPLGFEGCKHAPVSKDCSDGWCKLPASCFVMGPKSDEWHKGRDHEQVAVTLTHGIEVQQEELGRKQWEEITQVPAPGPDNCTDPECPVAMVSWWDAVHAANLLSEQRGLEKCYEPVSCTGTLGVDLECTGVAEPEKSVYECEGYRLPTRAEAEYAARAGTVSTWYSGNITPYYPDNVCAPDPALELIAWYCNNSGGHAHQGGELAPNDFGLYDMIGNLGEWTNEEAFYASSLGGSDPRGEVGTDKNRSRFSPMYENKSWVLETAGLVSATWDLHGDQLGFRLVRTLPD